MLGSDLIKVFASHEISGIGKQSDRHKQIPYLETDIADRNAVLKAVALFKPAIVIHTAAYTDVDGCEKNPDQAFSVNVKGTEHVREASEACGAVLIFISSDYVFDGKKTGSYQEGDQPNPLSVYGRTKYEAEELLKARSRSVCIVRSGWLFGANGKNFFRTIMEKALQEKELQVVNDQKGAPTYTKDLAQGIKMVAERANRISGHQIYHLANTGQTSWFEAARKVTEKMRAQVLLKPISSEILNRPAKRPANSVLNMTKIKDQFGIELRKWDEAFNEFWSMVLEKEWQSVTASR